MTSPIQLLPISHLPLPPSTLQEKLSRLPLTSQPSSQRRSTTFAPTSRGIWARVTPMWSEWPVRITKDEALEMGVDIEKGEKISVEDVLGRWDASLTDKDEQKQITTNGLEIKTSTHRMKLHATLVGISESARDAVLPHLDIGPDPTSVAYGELVDILSGRRMLSRQLPEYGPWSTRYCGHQFGVWAGQLGDGRAISVLETTSDKAGRQEIQVKGVGRTPFSRTADGLAVLRSSVREYLGCEAVAALGIPTTRALAILTSPDVPVYRENGAEPSSIVARVAPSFIRIGHFEALNPGESARKTHTMFLGGSGWLNNAAEENEDKDDVLGGYGNLEGLRDLVSWVKDDIEGYSEGVHEWFLDVVRRNARTVAGWQVYGFMHGVLNTDNISILGLTIDYGPYAFMDLWNDSHICNHSDPTGLYSYRAQPSRVLYALDSLSRALLPLIGYTSLHGPAAEGWSIGASSDNVREWEKRGLEVLGEDWHKTFSVAQNERERELWGKRFGLKTYRDADDRDVVFDHLTLLRAHGADFHASLRHISSFQISRAEDSSYMATFAKQWVSKTTTGLHPDAEAMAQEAFGTWMKVYVTRIKLELDSWENDDARIEAMRTVNPRFVLRQWVLEEVIKKMEDGLREENVEVARSALAQVLRLSINPFESYGEDNERDSCADDVEDESARLCGLGPRGMLGFQCSCSS